MATGTTRSRITHIILSNEFLTEAALLAIFLYLPMCKFSVQLLYWTNAFDSETTEKLIGNYKDMNADFVKMPIPLMFLCQPTLGKQNEVSSHILFFDIHGFFFLRTARLYYIRCRTTIKIN